VQKDSHPSISKVVQIGVICNNAEIVDGNLQGQPTEGALLACAYKVLSTIFAVLRLKSLVSLQLDLENVRYEYNRLQEWPFNSDTKFMAVRCTQRNKPVN
jgi:Ca2+-transporting ATPase